MLMIVEADDQRVGECLHLEPIQDRAAGRPFLLDAEAERLDVDDEKREQPETETIIVEEAKVLRLGSPAYFFVA